MLQQELSEIRIVGTMEDLRAIHRILVGYYDPAFPERKTMSDEVALRRSEKVLSAHRMADVIGDELTRIHGEKLAAVGREESLAECSREWPKM